MLMMPNKKERKKPRVVMNTVVDRETGKHLGKFHFDEGKLIGDHPSKFPKLIGKLSIFWAEYQSGFTKRYEVIRDEEREGP